MIDGISKGDKTSVIRKNSTSGITLIALVVTIVVLIILATISINAVFGENGLIKRAEAAKKLHEQGVTDEQEGLNDIDKYIENKLNQIIEGTGTTPEEPEIPTRPVSELQKGEIVNYTDKNGVARKCVVLYEPSSEYGLQVMVLETTKEKIGFSGYTISMDGSSSMITVMGKPETFVTNSYDITSMEGTYGGCLQEFKEYFYSHELNQETPKSYMNEELSSKARSFGSSPDFAPTNDELLTDIRHELDINKIRTLKSEMATLTLPGEICWLGSRNWESCYYYDSANDQIGQVPVLKAVENADGTTTITFTRDAGGSYGIRPIFDLKSDARISTGNGTFEDPYQLVASK